MSKMNLANFERRLRALYNIDHHWIEEVVSEDEWPSFRDDPVRYFIRASDDTQIALWMEVQKRSEKWDV